MATCLWSALCISIYYLPQTCCLSRVQWLKRISINQHKCVMLSFCSDSSSNALYRSELECLKLWSICASYGYLHPEFRYGCTRDILDARVIIWQGRVLHLPLLAVCRNLLRSFSSRLRLTPQQRMAWLRKQRFREDLDNAAAIFSLRRPCHWGQDCIGQYAETYHKPTQRFPQLISVCAKLCFTRLCCAHLAFIARARSKGTAPSHFKTNSQLRLLIACKFPSAVYIFLLPFPLSSEIFHLFLHVSYFASQGKRTKFGD